jgi:hypothetical protein
MSDLDRVINSLYTHFILRDIAGKVLPGLLGGAGVLAGILPNEYETIVGIVSSRNPFFLGVGLYGFGLMLGLWFQYLGERFLCTSVLIHGEKNDLSAMRETRAMEIKFFEYASIRKDIHPYIIRKREHLVIFKEMSANYAVAIAISIISFSIGFAVRWVLGRYAHFGWNGFIWVIPISLISLFAVKTLIQQNSRLADEQRELERILIPKAVWDYIKKQSKLAET